MPRTRSGCFHSQVLPRYQRRESVVNEALKQVFLLGVSKRQTGRALATLVEEAVSASTVSEGMVPGIQVGAIPNSPVCPSDHCEGNTVRLFCDGRVGMAVS
jgi:hypothetical protein